MATPLQLNESRAEFSQLPWPHTARQVAIRSHIHALVALVAVTSVQGASASLADFCSICESDPHLRKKKKEPTVPASLVESSREFRKFSWYLIKAGKWDGAEEGCSSATCFSLLGFGLVLLFIIYLLFQFIWNKSCCVSIVSTCHVCFCAVLTALLFNSSV